MKRILPYILSLTIVWAATALAGEAPRLTRITGAGETVLEPLSIVRGTAGKSVRIGVDKGRSARYYDIQWYRNDVPIEGATGPDLVIGALTQQDLGTYKARLTTPCSQIMTSSIALELEQSSSEVISRPLMSEDFDLDDVRPNPVTDKAYITFHLPKTSKITITVVDLLGNNLATLVNTTLPSGTHTVEYAVKGTASASTLYNIMMEAPGYSRIKPMMVVK